MLINIALLIACVLTAVVGIPLVLRLIPPNPIYGVRTRRTAQSDNMWFEVNRFAGAALVIAGGLGAIMIMSMSARAWWAQLLVFLVLVGAAVGATFWFERRLGAMMDK